MANLEFESVSKIFPGPATALDRFSLSVAVRELVVLVGPSGAGKTTALRIATGLERATSGSICMDGHVIDNCRPKDRDMAMVFQQPALYPHLTVRPNAAFSLRMRGMPRDEIDRRVAQVATELRFNDLLDRYPDTLSDGQAQRVALARALVRRPNVLLLDEPFASLDAPLRAELRQEFHAAHRRDPLTTIFVTHDQDEALALADRLVVLRAGKIEQIGSPQEVYDRPANRFVAGFLGSPPMNFLHGQLAMDDGRLWFRQPNMRLPVSDSMKAALLQHAGHEVVLGVRPEALSVAATDRAAEEASLQATIMHREFQGDRWLIRCGSQSGELIHLFVDNVVPPAVGQALRLRLDSKRLLFFAADGRTLLMPPGGG